MFINPITAIENKWIQQDGMSQQLDDWKDTKLLGPNAIDFTANFISHVTNETDIIIDNTKVQQHATKHTLSVSDGYFTLTPGNVYDITSNLYVTLPEGVAALLVPRSSFTRNGMFITSGLYDSGFEGHIGCTLHVRAGRVKIEPGTRIGQIIFIASDSAGLYAGGYNQRPMWTLPAYTYATLTPEDCKHVIRY